MGEKKNQGETKQHDSAYDKSLTTVMQATVVHRRIPTSPRSANVLDLPTDNIEKHAFFTR
jgi:hypothetical protein